MGTPPGEPVVTVETDDLDGVSGRLWLAGAIAVTEEPGRLIAGFADEGAARAAAEAVGGTLELVEPGVWLDAWREFAHPVVAGRLVVVPAWIEPGPVGGLRLDIDPGRVFGHGGHPTTRLCLEALDRRLVGGERVLDVGCGSGVLSVAAAKLGASEVVAVDIDPAAIDVTLANAARNGVRIDASTTALGDVDGRYDLVLANIGADVLKELAPLLSARSDVLVLSGLLVDRVDDVAASYAGTATVTTLDGWAALTVTTA